EKIVSQVGVEVRARVKTGTRRIGLYVFCHGRDAERAKVMSDQRTSAAVSFGGRHVVFHQMMGKMVKRIAERREFPVKNGRPARGGLQVKSGEQVGGVGRQDDVVEGEIAVDQPHRRGRRQVVR